MNHPRQHSAFERLLSLFTSVRAGEGRCVALLCLQAFLLMVAYYLIRPVREALILTEGDPGIRSYAVGVQAALLILVIPAYGALVRHADPGGVYRRVNLFFAINLLIFFVLGQAGFRFGFVFFVWASIFAVMVVTQFWAFATDLFNAHAGQRLFGVIAIGVAAGAWAGSRLAAAGFEALGPYGLMLASALVLTIVIGLGSRARERVPEAARVEDAPVPVPSDGRVARWLGGFAVICGSRYLIGIAALVVLINWITSTGDYVLSCWLVEVARDEAPGTQGVFIGRFMGSFYSTITMIGFLIQLLLVSRIILAAGLARALLVTPVVLVAGFLLLGILPVFLLLQSVLVMQRSLDYSLLNTARNALLLPTSRNVKYQAKTAIDTFFYRCGDLLATLSIVIGAKLFDQGYLQFVWMILVLCITLALVAWLVGREYSRRYGLAAGSGSGGAERSVGPRTVLAQ
jgi:AAA family ATP:ADP antiporter